MYAILAVNGFCVLFSSLIVILILGAYILKISSHSFLMGKEFENSARTNDDIFYLTKSDIMNPKITMGNDEFILYIRKWHPNCSTITSQLGKLIWIWLEARDAIKSPLKPKHSYWDKSGNVNKDMLPEHATQFEFDRCLLPGLYDYLDELGSK